MVTRVGETRVITCRRGMRRDRQTHPQRRVFRRERPSELLQRPRTAPVHQQLRPRQDAPLRLRPGARDDHLPGQLRRRHVTLYAQGRQVRRTILRLRLLRLSKSSQDTRGSIYKTSYDKLRKN